MLSPDVIAVIKLTIPVLEAGGEELTRHFYRRMFAGNPEVKAFFNAAHQHSGGAAAGARGGDPGIRQAHRESGGAGRGGGADRAEARVARH